MEARSAAAKAPCIQCGQPRNARSSGKGLCGSCYQRAYRATNPEKLKAWRDSRPVERKANAQRYIERHPGSVYARTKAWREKNRDAFFVHLQRRRALKANAPINDFTAEQWTAVQEAAGGRCHYCHEVKPLSMDHVVPLVKGGAHTAANIVPACRRCNSRKRAKSYEEFMAVLAAEAVA
jgi:5-methylcytosine-specific restriction endonuclease McrA